MRRKDTVNNIKQLLAVLACAVLIGGCATEGTQSGTAAKPAAAPGSTEAKPAAAAADDAALNSKVQAALKADQYVGPLNVKSTSNTNGDVALSGSVRNDFQKYQAEAVTKKVTGVKKIDNKIKVE